MGKTGAKYTQLTQNEFDIIKGLQKNFKSSQIEKLTGRSSATVHYIFNSETMEDYKKTVRDIHERRLARQQNNLNAIAKDNDKMGYAVVVNDIGGDELLVEPDGRVTTENKLDMIYGILTDVGSRLSKIEEYISSPKNTNSPPPVSNRRWRF